MTAISRNKVKIYIAAAGTAPSAITATDLIAGEIKSYSKSGGEKDVESDPVFGGFVDKEKAPSQFEISMEVVPSLENASRWDALAYAVNNSDALYTTKNVDIADKAIFIYATDGTNHKSWGFNNCNVTVFDIEHNADDNMTGNITFKFSPTTSSGIPNFQTKATTLAGLTAWASLATS